MGKVVVWLLGWIRNMWNLFGAERLQDGVDMLGVANKPGSVVGSNRCSKTSSLAGGTVVTGEYEVASNSSNLPGNLRVRVVRRRFIAGCVDGKHMSGFGGSMGGSSARGSNWASTI